jgi:hypothetical protein
MNVQTYISQTPQYNDNDSAGMDTLSTTTPLISTPEVAVNHPATMHKSINSTINSHKGNY